MSDFLDKVFDYVVSEESYAIKADKRTNAVIKKLTAPYTATMDADQIEELRNMVAEANYTAEKIGFEIGVRCAVQVMIELLFCK